IRHRQAIVKEGDVKLASFEDTGDLLVIFGRMGVIARLRVSPGARQVGAVLRLQKADHHHLPRHIPSPDTRGPVLGGKLILEQRRRTSGPSSASVGRAKPVVSLAEKDLWIISMAARRYRRIAVRRLRSDLKRAR